MNRTAHVVFIVTAAAAGGFAAGYFTALRSPHRDSDGSIATNNPTQDSTSAFSDASLVAAFAESASRGTRPFDGGQAEYLAHYQKQEQQKAEFAKRGARIAGEIIRFLGPAGTVSKLQANALDDSMKLDAPVALRLDPAVRAALVEMLATSDRTLASRDLSQRLLDANETSRVRSMCAGQLAHLDREVALPALLEALDKATERPWDNCRAIAEALQAIGGKEAEAGLLKAMQRQTTEPGLRMQCVQALGLFKSKDAAPALETLVRFETRDHYVRREAIRSLLKIDPDHARQVLKEHTPTEADPAFKLFLTDVAREVGVTIDK
jgi:hypothetical protein